MQGSLSDLIAALAAATGPSRELDAEISTLLFGLPIWKPRNCDHFVSIYSAPIPCEPPRYTASLDAITGAIETKWPIVSWSVNSFSGATVGTQQNFGHVVGGHMGRSALPLCLAAARLALAEGGR